MFPHRGFGPRETVPETALKAKNIRRESGVGMSDFSERGLLILHVAIGFGEIPDIGFSETVSGRRSAKRCEDQGGEKQGGGTEFQGGHPEEAETGW